MTVSNAAPLSGLAAAYGEDEPDYTLDMLINKNPDYILGIGWIPVAQHRRLLQNLSNYLTST